MADGFDLIPKNSNGVWMLAANAANYVAEWNSRILGNKPEEFLGKSVGLWASEQSTLNTTIFNTTSTFQFEVSILTF